MPTYRITECQPTWVMYSYDVEADSEDAARELFDQGDLTADYSEIQDSVSGMDSTVEIEQIGSEE